MSDEQVLIISPVRNEAAHIEQVIDGMAGQRRPPDAWVVVDDRSEDDTLAILRANEHRLPFLRVLQAPEQGIPAGADRLRAAADAVAFNWALRQVGDIPYGFIGKLDGDIALAPEHFERLLAEFAAEPRLGACGCYLEYEDRGRWRLQEMPDYHVPGPVKLYRRRCFEDIGGMLEMLGWDTADEVYARMHGWRTRSLRDLRARHLKAPGSVGGFVHGKVRHGECVWIVNYPASVVALRSLRLLPTWPPVIAGLAYAWGYARARLRGLPQIPDPELLDRSRAEQRARVRAELRRRLRVTSRTDRPPSAPPPPPAARS